MSCGSERTIDGEVVTCARHFGHQSSMHIGVMDDLSTLTWDGAMSQDIPKQPAKEDVDD